MATPSPQPTRHHLDELDALLQRMLALPVNAGDEGAPDAAAVDELVLAPPLPPPPPVHAELPPPAPEYYDAPPGNVIVSDPLMDLMPPPPLAPVRPDPQPAAMHPEEIAPVPVVPSPPPQAFVPRPSGSSRPPEVPWILQPVVAINRAYDRVALGLGAPGRWLRRPGGRALLGYTGLMLLAGAVAHVLWHRMGWTW